MTPRGKPLAADMAAAARDAFLVAFDELGGAKALAAWARDNPTQFYTMFAKLIPAQAEIPTAPAEVSEAPLSEREWSTRARDAA